MNDEDQVTPRPQRGQVHSQTAGRLEQRSDRTSKLEVRWPVAAVFVWLVAQVATVTLAGGPPGGRLFIWDGALYRLIAERGYTAMPGRPHPLTAFFPIEPAVLRTGAWLGLRYTVTAVVFSVACTTAAAILLHRIVERIAGTTAARWSVAALLAWPTSLFLWLPYTEAPTLALTLWAVNDWQAQRYRRSGVACALAAMTRFTGSLTMVALGVTGAVRLSRGRRVGWDAVLWPLAGVVGLAAVTFTEWASAGLAPAIRSGG